MSNIQKAIKIGAICFAVFIIISIVNGILFGISLLGGLDNQAYHKVDFSENYQNVQKMILDISNAEIIIQSGSKLMVEATNVSDNFSSNAKDETLYVKEKKHFWSSKKTGKIVITVPPNSNLEELRISSGAGKIELTDLTINKAVLSQGAGLLKIENCVFLESTIDGGAGELNITSSILQNLDLNAGVGKVLIEGDIVGKSKIDCGIGEVKLKLDQKEKYNFDIEKGIGSIRIDGEDYGNTKYGSGPNEVEIDGGIGSVQIDFKE